MQWRQKVILQTTTDDKASLQVSTMFQDLQTNMSSTGKTSSMGLACAPSHHSQQQHVDGSTDASLLKTRYY